MGVMKVHTPPLFASASVGVLGLLSLIALFVALPGCPSGPDDPTDLERARADGKALFTGSRQPARGGGRSWPLVRLRATVVAFPAGTVTRSEAVWDKLDHKPWTPNVRALLTLNGLRVGMMKSKAWPELVKTFEDLKGIRLRSAKLPAYPAAPVQVFLQRNGHYRTVFSYRLDETMFGMDYPPGDSLLSVQCLVDPRVPSRMTMAVMPLLQASRQKMRYTKSDGQYTFTKVPILSVFPELAWKISVTTDDIVMLGPGRRAARSSSVGRMFFFTDVNGVPFETVLLLAPDVTMVGGPDGPTPPPAARPTSRPDGPSARPMPTRTTPGSGNSSRTSEEPR